MVLVFTDMSFTFQKISWAIHIWGFLVFGNIILLGGYVIFDILFYVSMHFFYEK